MAGIKEKEVVTPEAPKIKIHKIPEAEMRLKVIPKLAEVKEEAREATTEAEKNAVKVAQSFVDHFTDAINKTPEGREFLKNKVGNSEIGTLLFKSV